MKDKFNKFFEQYLVVYHVENLLEIREEEAYPKVAHINNFKNDVEKGTRVHAQLIPFNCELPWINVVHAFRKNPTQDYLGYLAERSSPAATKKDFAPGDHLCQDLVLCFGDTSIINSIDADTAANKVAHLLNLNKLSMMDPPDDLVKKCRYFCACLKKEERGDIVKELRKLLPNGMTGPLCDGETLVKDMDSRSKQRLSRALAVKVEWKAFAEKAGVSRDDIEYYDNREKNPVLSILEEHCGNITVDQLYILIVESGANAIADYL